MVFLQENALAPARTSVIVLEFLSSKWVVVLSHPPYSPYLSPCDYFLFPNFKFHLKVTTFTVIPDTQATATDYWMYITKVQFQNCFDDSYIGF